MSVTLFPLPQTIATDECTVYHDESKRVFKNVWAHGLLFVPESASAELLSRLWEVRRRHGCEHKKLQFADISGGRICAADGSLAIREWIQHGVEALRHKRSQVFRPPLKCKLGVIFFSTSLDLDMYGGEAKDERMLRYFETVLRMLLKGCAHYLYGADNKLRIKGIVTDGEPWRRGLDETRILEPLALEAREYVDIDSTAYIEGIVSDHTARNCVDRDRAQLLQLTDLLLGSVIHSCFRDLKRGSKKEVIIRPVREMLQKRERGRNFQRSGHYRAFAISFAHVEKDQWNFQQVDARQIVYENNQLQLFELNEDTR